MREDLINKLYSIKEKIFSFVNEAESLFNRAILLGLLVVFLIWFNLGNIIDLIVSENRIKQNVIEKLTEATGKKTEIAGDVIFKSEPEPVIVISKTKILNNSKLTNENFFEAETIKTKPQILKAIFGSADFDNIYFENVKINIDSTEEGSAYDAISRIFSEKSELHDKKIIFKNLQVNLYKQNPFDEKHPITRRLDFPELELDPKPERKAAYSIKGSVDSNKFKETYFFDLDIKDGFTKDSGYEGRIYSNTTDLTLSGMLNTKDKTTFSGKMAGKISGISKKIFSLIGVSDKFLETLKENDESKVSANYVFDGQKLNISDFVGDSKIIAFALNSSTQVGKTISSTVDVNISKFDYSEMFKTRVEILSEKKAQRIERDFKKKLEEYFLFAIGNDVNFILTLNIPKIDFFHAKEGSLIANAELKDNNFKVNSFKVKLPGEAAINFVGVVDINKEEKKLKGSTRVIFAGKNMDELIYALDVDGVVKKEQRFGPFYIDATGFLYGQNVHFRDIVARINDDKFAGQMLIDYSNELKSSAAIDFTSLNIDKYLASDTEDKVALGLLREENPLASKFDFLRIIDSVFDKLDISLTADKMVKQARDYTDVSVYAHITPGITDVKDIYFNSDMLGDVKGNAYLDLTDFQPKLDVNLNIDKYDLDLLMYGEEVRQNDTYDFDGKWSTEKVSFEKLGTFQGKLNIQVGELKIYHFLIKNFALSSHNEEGKFIVDRARVDLFGNKLDIRGFLTTEFPSFSLSFIASDLDANEFLQNTFGMDQVTSIFNMSGVLTSMGYSIDQMIQNLKGSFSVATKGFKVSGFDLAAVGKALPLAKRREYINIISEELLNKGETEFSFFTGAFGIDAGKIMFKNLMIEGPNINKSSVSGIIDLPKWQIDILSNLNVLTTGSGAGRDFPLMGRTTGTMPNINTNWDTTGMTQYWENKFFNSR